jgi:hypothetical protein
MKVSAILFVKQFVIFKLVNSRSVLKGSDDGILQLLLLNFWILCIIRYSVLTIPYSNHDMVRAVKLAISKFYWH